jgi:hypothetical protein
VTAQLVFNLAAAQDAQARLDEGVAREGDELLAAHLEGYLQQEWDRYWDPIHAAEANAAQQAVEGICHDGWHDREGDGIAVCPTCGEPDEPMPGEAVNQP